MAEPHTCGDESAIRQAETDRMPTPRCLSVDLEVGKDGRIHALAAVRADTDQHLTHSRSGLTAALARLDDLADGADFLLGHNLIAFDLPHLKKHDLPKLEALSVVDTLRLSPLAFPRHPYHKLVKHYQDGGLKPDRVNDPLLDSLLTLELFRDERKALAETAKAEPDLVAAWHRLCTPDPANVDRALDEMFRQIRQDRRPSPAETTAAIKRMLKIGQGQTKACAAQAQEIMADSCRPGWPLAYALAWISEAGGNSVLPPWVRRQFPAAAHLVSRLRDAACGDPMCHWCRERHDPVKELKRWFGYPGFRSEPTHDDKPMQQAIVEKVMAGQHALGILPTGTGKSLCYQLPALSRYHKTGALAVVISPLVALMADQVSKLEQAGIGCCVTVNGLLSLPERADALDRVRMGDAGILLISPELLRSRSLRRALDQREIGAWVLDEAHCLSRWGHDFRPDYRYFGRFIREQADGSPIPAVLCLTATAKPEVVDDITRHFRDRLGIELTVFDGGAERANLNFKVIETTEERKFSAVLDALTREFPPDSMGGAIVYCATRRQCEDVAEYLRSMGIAADRFHAGLPPETKKHAQQRFVAGELQAIAATNAFGMGIDKPDVRLVIHADMPGSLENYFQEAGRAGRDRKPAHCILLYAEEDVERQFRMSARSRLARREIHGVLKALVNHNRKNRGRSDLVLTAGEILGEDHERAFLRDSATDDTRVRTAIAWLEESSLLTREENIVQVFPSSLRVESVGQARKLLERTGIAEAYRRQLLQIAETLIIATPDEGVTTDELMAVSRLGRNGLRKALYDLERFGIASNDTALTAFVHAGVSRSSQRRLEQAGALETALIAHMREAAPDLAKGDSSFLHLRIAAQALRDQGLADALPERLLRIVRSIANDGRSDKRAGSITVRKHDSETVRVKLEREWGLLEELAKKRRNAADHVLRHLTDCLPPGSRGNDLLAATTLGKLLQAVESDLLLTTGSQNSTRLLDRTLLWLHEQEVLRLNRGLAVFRPAMTIRLKERSPRIFTKADFDPLALHYKGQVLQIHVMAEFARRGLADIGKALGLATEYFLFEERAFLNRWLPGRDRETSRQTTPASWHAIVESLGNPIQQRIVTDPREQANMLVLAGPGSGKTRVLVHRIAWLIRVRRANAQGILALAYNRHAAVEIRRRRGDLIGDDALGVTVLTCHALAMRLVGASFSRSFDRPDDNAFREIMEGAVKLLHGEELPPEEADERRTRLLAGFQWILVDEYQDIGPEQYELISALVGRTLKEDADKLSLFAVGDDDQNIYAFNHASVKFIRRFETDYKSKLTWLTANYRSTAHITAAANAMIEPARDRMKGDHPIHVDRRREADPPGGEWAELDPVSKGRVQVLPAGRNPVQQAQAVMEELLRLSRLSAAWEWSKCAVIARRWALLDPVRAFCEANGVPAQVANEDFPGFWRLRETQAFVERLRQHGRQIVNGKILRDWTTAAGRRSNPWQDMLRQAVEEHSLEAGDADIPVSHFIEWLAEWGREVRRRQRGLLLLTAHRGKGLEFDHVAVLDGDWARTGCNEDVDAPRRLYYVAMTRARQTLTLATLDGSRGFQAALLDHPATILRKAARLPPCPKAMFRRHVRPALKEVDLGFAGRHGSSHSIHRAIAQLSIGDPLSLGRDAHGRWLLLNQAGKTVGRLAKSFRPRTGSRCHSAKVFAVVRWNRKDSDEKYHSRIRCDAWEVVVPEFLFEPELSET